MKEATKNEDDDEDDDDSLPDRLFPVKPQPVPPAEVDDDNDMISTMSTDTATTGNWYC